MSVLRVLLLNTNRDFYQRELAQLSSEHIFQTQRAVKALEEIGLVGSLTRGNRTYYRVNRDHPVFSDLRSLVLKTIGAGDELRAALRPFEKRIRLAFLYGSMARGEETATSDIDVMIVGDISSREIATALASVRRRIRREVNTTVYPPAELRRRYLERHPFVRDVAKGPKVFLIGEERGFQEVLGRRSP